MVETYQLTQYSADILKYKVNLRALQLPYVHLWQSPLPFRNSVCLSLFLGPLFAQWPLMILSSTYQYIYLLTVHGDGGPSFWGCNPPKWSGLHITTDVLSHANALIYIALHKLCNASTNYTLPSTNYIHCHTCAHTLSMQLSTKWCGLKFSCIYPTILKILDPPLLSDSVAIFWRYIITLGHYKVSPVSTATILAIVHEYIGYLEGNWYSREGLWVWESPLMLTLNEKCAVSFLARNHF